jgi:hypothetical protein
MVMPSIGVVRAGTGAAFVATVFLVATLFLGAVFFTAGFLAVAFGGVGMVMPGMDICAAAGAANSPAVPIKSDNDFSGKPFKRSALDRSTEGAVHNARSAAAVLAGARVAAAAAARRTATILFNFFLFANAHFLFPFLVAQSERITL